MKKLRIFYLFFVFIGFTACHDNPPHETVINATSFCEAFYDLDYVSAKNLATASSFPYISFIATNTAQKHIDIVKARGPVTVAVVDTQVNETEGKATVVCTVKNSLNIDYFDGTSFIIPEKQDTLHLIKEGERWLVKMDNPLQSGMRNRD
ncbi:hypothetical protein [Bacteroides sp.]